MKKLTAIMLLVFATTGYAALPITNILMCPQNVSGTFNQNNLTPVVQNGVKWYYVSYPYSLNAPSVTAKNVDTTNQVNFALLPPTACAYVACVGTTSNGAQIAFVHDFCKGNISKLTTQRVGTQAWEYNNPQ